MQSLKPLGDVEYLIFMRLFHAEILEHWCHIVLFDLIVHHLHAFHLFVEHLHQAAAPCEGGVGSQPVVTLTTSLDGEVDDHLDCQSFQLPKRTDEIPAFTTCERLLVRRHNTLVCV